MLLRLKEAALAVVLINGTQTANTPDYSSDPCTDNTVACWDWEH